MGASSTQTEARGGKGFDSAKHMQATTIGGQDISFLQGLSHLKHSEGDHGSKININLPKLEGPDPANNTLVDKLPFLKKKLTGVSLEQIEGFD